MIRNNGTIFKSDGFPVNAGNNLVGKNFNTKPLQALTRFLHKPRLKTRKNIRCALNQSYINIAGFWGWQQFLLQITHKVFKFRGKLNTGSAAPSNHNMY